jgi:hypothetical protein
MGMESMKKIAAVALASLAIASTPTQAADLFGTAPPPLGEPASNPEVEIGSNWYIRGDLGYGEVNSPTIVPSAGLIPRSYTTFPARGRPSTTPRSATLPQTLPSFVVTTRPRTTAFSMSV